MSIDLSGLSIRAQNAELLQLATSHLGVVLPPSDEGSVRVDIIGGRLHVSVNGYNVFFVFAPRIQVAVYSEGKQP